MRRLPKILIVDDEPFNVDFLRQELEDLGYETAVATDGREALAKVPVETPDIILLDVMMPGMDGLTTCRLLKEDSRMRAIPVVLMTALDGAADRLRGLEAGADAFLTKPVDPSVLAERLRAVLGRGQTGA